MADTVRSVLEEMVPELEDLERRGYFSRAEIRQIAAKRQDFEYALKRRASVQADYLRYIEYEGALERLRQLRRKQRAVAGPSSLADHCIVRRTHFIYERMLRKFRGDLTLWARWLRFCQRSGSGRQMSRVLTKALQLHSTCAALWTHAAAWEFEHNANAAAARALMQRGLRMCKGQQALWHEYFRMEALYAARLAARREVLGIAAGSDDGEGGAKVLGGAIARVVYNSAVADVPGSLAFRAKFLDVLRPLSLPGKEELEAYIYDDIQTAFTGSVEALELRARRLLQRGEGGAAAARTAALAVYEDALQQRASPELLDSLLHFLESELQAALAQEHAAEALDLVRRCCGVVERAAEGGGLSDYMQLAAPRMNLRMGQLAAAAAAAAQSGDTTRLSPPAQRQLITLRAAASALGVEDAAAVPGLGAVRSEGGRRCVDVWLCAIRMAVAGEGSLDALAQALIEQQRGSARGPVTGGMGAVAAALLHALWSPSNPTPARDFYRSLLTLPLPGGQLIHAALDLELSLLTGRLPAALREGQIKEICEAGATAYGADDAALWLRYLRFEQGRAGAGGAGQVHWRAVKALTQPDEFVARVHLLNLGYADAMH